MELAGGGKGGEGSLPQAPCSTRLHELGPVRSVRLERMYTPGRWEKEPKDNISACSACSPTLYKI